MRGSSATSLVRVPVNRPEVIGHFLDAGAEGVMVPAVQNVAEAEQAVGSCRYYGLRSYGSLRTSYLADGWRREILCVVMVETEAGVGNVEAIANVEGVDAIFLGPNDLSFSLGINPDERGSNEKYTSSVARIRDACKGAGIAYGASGTARQLKAEGCQMISLGGDSLFIESAMTKALQERL
jgi:4-hydroxy-2-oxoheptanedioate aldolase